MKNPKSKLNWPQQVALWHIYEGRNKYESHDRRTLNALLRRKLVKYNKNTVVLTARGKSVAEGLNGGIKPRRTA